MTNSKITRREFFGRTMRAAAAASVFSIVPRHVLGGPGFTPPSEQLTQALIGSGAQGRSHINWNGFRCLAICDVDANHLKQGLDLAGKGAKGYTDWREVIALPGVDVIDIATPPHWHGIMSIAAAEAGKDVWCEKPMSYSIGEGERVLEAVRRTGCIYRINTWFRFENQFYDFGTPVMPIKKLVQSGLLGWPLKVTISKSTGFPRLGSEWVGMTNLTPQAVPPELDYDMWLGPAPYRPYHPHRVHLNFRGYWDYDGGNLGDMGQHYIDPVQYILGKDDESPVEIEAAGPQQHPDAVVQWRQIRMRYADGCEILLDAEDRDPQAPYISGPGGKLWPKMRSDIPNLEKKLAEFPDPEPQLTDFATAMRTRQKFALNEANAHRSCTLVNLAKIALQLGRPLHFNPKTQRFVNDGAANRLIHRPAREPWVI